MFAMPILVFLLATAGRSLADLDDKPLVVSMEPSNYKSLLIAGQRVGKETFGALYDREGKAIMANNYEVRGQ